MLVGSRAGGFHSRTIEVLDQRGVADRFLAEGEAVQVAMFATTVLDMSDFPTRHPYALGIWQSKIERIMAAWIAELPVRIYHGCEVTGCAQDDSGVHIRLADGGSPRAEYLVGCDGGRSVIRKAAGIEFPGWEPTKSNLIAEVEMTEEPPRGIRHDATGVHGRHRMVQVVNGISAESLLDTYHAERHPVAARALRHTMAQTALLQDHDGAHIGAWPGRSSVPGGRPRLFALQLGG